MTYDWEVVACIQYPNGELVDKNKPFATYHVEANTYKKAVEKLKKDFNMCEVTVIHPCELYAQLKTESPKG